MNKPSLLYLALAALLLMSWVPTDKLSTANIILVFENLVDNSSTKIPGTISVSNVTPLVDNNLKELLPNTTFYYLNINNASSFEYNNGNIQTIAAISTTESNDIRLLLPQSYAKSSANFFNLFFNKPIKHKANCCKSIANLLLKTYTRAAFNCDKEMRGLHQTTTLTANTITVSTTWKEMCRNIDKADKVVEPIVVNKNTTFTFVDDKITNILYSDWSK